MQLIGTDFLKTVATDVLPIMQAGAWRICRLMVKILGSN